MGSGRKQPAKAMENPFRPSGGYWAAGEALRSLGLGRLHPFDALVPAIRDAMGDGWTVFAAKQSKLTPEKRALQNVMVLSRLDYGKPLRVVGYQIRWDGRRKVAGLFRVGSGKASGAAKKAKTATMAAKAAKKS